MCIWVKDGNTKRWNGLGWKIFTSFFVWSFSPSDISCEKIEPTLKEQMKRKRKSLVLWWLCTARPQPLTALVCPWRAGREQTAFVIFTSTITAQKVQQKVKRKLPKQSEHQQNILKDGSDLLWRKAMAGWVLFVMNVHEGTTLTLFSV